jgi:hypothetical protein
LTPTKTRTKSAARVPSTSASKASKPKRAAPRKKSEKKNAAGKKKSGDDDNDVEGEDNDKENADREDGDENTALFDIVNSGKASLQTAVNEWVEEYNEDSLKALNELINFVFQVFTIINLHFFYRFSLIFL